MRQGQLHAYDNRENVLKTIGSGRLTARPPSPEILERICRRQHVRLSRGDDGIPDGVNT